MRSVFEMDTQKTTSHMRKTDYRAALENPRQLFGGALEASIELDKSWHLRGGAGGAHPGSSKIVLDPVAWSLVGFGVAQRKPRYGNMENGELQVLGFAFELHDF